MLSLPIAEIAERLDCHPRLFKVLKMLFDALAVGP
jgi:hypothetical protein